MSLQVYLSAGLGNRLFQYASVKGFAKKYNLDFNIFAIDYNHEHNFNNYDWFLQKIITHNTQCLQIPRRIIMNTHHIQQAYPLIKIWFQPEKEHIGYFEPNVDIVRDKVLYGYFQSEKYFENIADEIRHQFKEPINITPIINEYIESLNKQGIDINQCCIVHVRLKDKLGDARHFVHYGKYYERAINLVKKSNPNTYFLVLSETPEDINRIYPDLLGQLGIDNKTYSFVPRNYSNLDLFDFYLLTRISIIIGSCSTFVWWGAWLNPIPFPEKEVYFPNKFTNDLVNNYVDMKGAQFIEVD